MTQFLSKLYQVIGAFLGEYTGTRVPEQANDNQHNFAVLKTECHSKSDNTDISKIRRETILRPAYINLQRNCVSTKRVSAMLLWTFVCEPRRLCDL